MASSLNVVLFQAFFLTVIFTLTTTASPVQKSYQDGVLGAHAREIRNVRSAGHKKKGEVDMGLLNSMLNLKPTLKPVDLPEAVAVTAPENFRKNLGKRKDKEGKGMDMDLLNSMLNLKPTIKPIDLPEEVMVSVAPNFREVKNNVKGKDKKNHGEDDLDKRINELLERVDQLEKGQ